MISSYKVLLVCQFPLNPPEMSVGNLSLLCLCVPPVSLCPSCVFVSLLCLCVPPMSLCTSCVFVYLLRLWWWGRGWWGWREILTSELCSLGGHGGSWRGEKKRSVKLIDKYKDIWSKWLENMTWRTEKSLDTAFKILSWFNWNRKLLKSMGSVLQGTWEATPYWMNNSDERLRFGLAVPNEFFNICVAYIWKNTWKKWGPEFWRTLGCDFRFSISINSSIGKMKV